MYCVILPLTVHIFFQDMRPPVHKSLPFKLSLALNLEWTQEVARQA